MSNSSQTINNTTTNVCYEWRKINGKHLYAEIIQLEILDESSNITSKREIINILDIQPDYNKYLASLQNKT